jgi:hypothetical protein
VVFRKDVRAMISCLSIGLTEGIVRAKGIKNFSLYSKRVSGAILVVVGIYYGVTYKTYIEKYANA